MNEWQRLGSGQSGLSVWIWVGPDNSCQTASDPFFAVPVRSRVRPLSPRTASHRFSTEGQHRPIRSRSFVARPPAVTLAAAAYHLAVPFFRLSGTFSGKSKREKISGKLPPIGIGKAAPLVLSRSTFPCETGSLCLGVSFRPQTYRVPAAHFSTAPIVFQTAKSCSMLGPMER